MARSWAWTSGASVAREIAAASTSSGWSAATTLKPSSSRSSADRSGPGSSPRTPPEAARAREVGVSRSRLKPA